MRTRIQTALLSVGVVALASVGLTAALAPTTQPSAVQAVVTGEAAKNVELAVVEGGPAKGKRAEQLEPHAVFYGPLPTVFDFSNDGDRLFVAFPRWTQPTNFTVAEVKDGQLVPFPNADTNRFQPTDPDQYDPSEHLVSVQSLRVDGDNRLWLLDTGSINMQPVIDGGAKLWGFDLSSGEQVKKINFKIGESIKKTSYLNDVRFDLTRGEEGYAFITDSGEGAIIVVDLATGESWRKLEGHDSTKAKDITLMAEGEELKMRPPEGEAKPVKIASDGIALSPDGSTLYVTPLTGRTLYALPTDALVDRNADAASQARVVAQMPSANDGIVADSQGRIYTTDFEDNAIRRIAPPEQGQPQLAGEQQNGVSADDWEVVVQDERILWPDCVIIEDGHVYFTANQLNRQPQFHHGRSLLNGPFVLFRYPVEAEAVERH